MQRAAGRHELTRNVHVETRPGIKVHLSNGSHAAPPNGTYARTRTLSKHGGGGVLSLEKRWPTEGPSIRPIGTCVACMFRRVLCRSHDSRCVFQKVHCGDLEVPRRR